LAYVMNLFPNLTETFVYREIDTLRARGSGILTFSIRRPHANDVSAEARKYFADTHYILPVSVWAFLVAHVVELVRQPVLYLQLAYQALTGTHSHWGDRLRSLAHFAEAIAVVPIIRDAGVRHLHAHFAVGATTIAWVAGRMLNLPFSFTAHAYDI